MAAQIIVGSERINRREGTRTWQAGRELGRGGQGIVVEATELVESDAAVAELVRSVRYAASPVNLSGENFGPSLVAALKRVAASERPGFALKLYDPSLRADASAVIRRSEAEAAALAALSHPRIIRIEDSGVLADNRRFSIFPEFHRGTLVGAQREFSGRPLACLRAVDEVLSAVEHIHAKGLVHRDLKPENVFVDDDRGLVVADFGLVFDSEREESLTRTGERVGNWQFGPDWVYADVAHQQDPRVDLYAVAKMLWWLASGKPLLPREDWKKPVFNLVKLFPGESNMALVNEVLERGMASEPESMGYADAAAMGAHVRSIIDEIESRRHGARTSPRACRACQSGTYRSNDAGRFEDLAQWLHDVNRLGASSSSRVASIKMFRCDACGHLVWYAEHPSPKPK